MDKELSELPIDSVKDRVARLDLDSYPVRIYDSGERERRLDSIEVRVFDMERGEGKIATGRFRINKAGAREGSSFHAR